jgi:hypothetical protein
LSRFTAVLKPERQRRRDIGVRAKHHQPDAIRRALLDELPQNSARHFQPVHPLAANLKILRLHAAGEIKCDDNVHAAGFDLGFTAGQSRLCQRHDQERERKPAQGRKPSARARTGDP